MPKSNRKEQKRRSIDYFVGQSGTLNGPKGNPFYDVRIEREQVERLRHALRTCAETGERRWFTLTATAEKPERLRLTEKPTPAYELSAAPVYVRGEAMRISGEQSCNIDFSGEVGAVLLEEGLATAQGRMRRFLDVRVPNRARNLIEFLADTDLEAMSSAEHDRLAEATGYAAAEVLGSEDFKDWEEAGV